MAASQAAKPLSTHPGEIRRISRQVVAGERDATGPELVATWRYCVDRHMLDERDRVLHALGAVIDWEDDR